MADTETRSDQSRTSSSQGGDSGGQQQGQGQQGQQQGLSQSQIDQMFTAQAQSLGLGQGIGQWQNQQNPQDVAHIQQIVAAYYEQAEQTLRTSRRISEMQAVSMMTDHLCRTIAAQVVPQIVPVVTAAVLSEVRRHPEAFLSR